jgi:hypothetical protein
MQHMVFQSIDAAAAKAVALSEQNIYFAVHTFREPRVWNPKHHHDKATSQWVGGWSVRTQANARECRAFFFDLDVGADDGAHFPSRQAAAADLKAFCHTVGLPRPMCTSSGGGIHVYWLITEPLSSSDEWFKRAVWLRQLAIHHKLKIDPKRTTDTASVLRVVGTQNIKPGRDPRPVTAINPTVPMTVDMLDTILLAALHDAGLEPEDRVNTAAPAGLPSNLSNTYDGPSPSFRSLLAVCPQTKRLVLSRGNVPEPQWWDGIIGNIQFVEDGERLVHKVSSGYKGYSQEETQARIERWRAKGGPVKCATLEATCGTFGSICKTCQYRSKDSHPVVLARLHEIPQPLQLKQVSPAGQVTEISIPAPPAPFRWGKDGSIEMLKESEDGKQYVSTIYPYTLYPLDRSFSRANETELQLWRAHLPHDNIRDFTVDASTLVDLKALKGRLANNGIYAEDFPALSQFMSAYIRKMLHDQPTNVQYDHLGWHKDRTQFVLPDRMFHADGAVTGASVSDAAQSTREFISKKGSMATQIAALQFYDDPAYVNLQFAIMAGLGSPLFYITGQHGAIINLTGDSGASKSSALYTIGSFWGPPDQYALHPLKNGATALARAQHASLLSNLPYCLDEITLLDPEEAKQLAFWISQAAGRTRLSQGGKMRIDVNNDRSLIAVTTSNKSLHSMLAANSQGTTASMVRVFEIDVRRQTVHRPMQADAYLRVLRQNYGWLGEKMAQVFVVNRVKIEARVIKMMETLGQQYNMRADERFWFGAVVIAYVTTEIANRLGIVSWSPQAILDYALVHQLPRLRAAVQDESVITEPINILTDYLERINSGVIKTSTNQITNLPAALENSHGALLAHYDTSTRTMWVLREGFRKYCQERGVYMRTILHALMDDKIVTADQVRRTLGFGTVHAKARSLCFVIDGNHPELLTLAPKLQAGPGLVVVQGGKATP